MRPQIWKSSPGSRRLASTTTPHFLMVSRRYHGKKSQTFVMSMVNWLKTNSGDLQWIWIHNQMTPYHRLQPLEAIMRIFATGRALGNVKINRHLANFRSTRFVSYKKDHRFYVLFLLFNVFNLHSIFANKNFLNLMILMSKFVFLECKLIWFSQ